MWFFKWVCDILHWIILNSISKLPLRCIHGNVDYQKSYPGKENIFYVCEINIFTINNDNPILTSAIFKNCYSTSGNYTDTKCRDWMWHTGKFNNPLDTTVEKNTSHKPVLTSAVNILHVPLHKHKSDLAFVTLLQTYIF